MSLPWIGTGMMFFGMKKKYLPAKPFSWNTLVPASLKLSDAVISNFAADDEAAQAVKEFQLFQNSTRRSTAEIVADFRAHVAKVREDERLERVRKITLKFGELHTPVADLYLQRRDSHKYFIGRQALDGALQNLFPTDNHDTRFIWADSLTDGELGAILCNSGGRSTSHLKEVSDAIHKAAQDEFSARVKEIDGGRPTLSVGEWLTAAALVFFNASSINGRADAFGRATGDKAVSNFCETLGIDGASESFRDHWYKPGFATLNAKFEAAV